MTNIDKVTFLTPKIAVKGFMTPRGLRIVKAMGFASVINLMPQAASALEDIPEKDLANRVRAYGLEYRKLSVNSVFEIDEDLIERFKDTVEEVPQPTVIFSRTGRRAVTLWALAMQNAMNWDELTTKASRAGFDISQIIIDEELSGSRAA